MSIGIIEEVKQIGPFSICERKYYRRDFLPKYGIFEGNIGCGDANTLREAEAKCKAECKRRGIQL